MLDQQTAQEVALKMASDAQFWAALIGFIGVIIGSILSIAGNLLFYWYQNRRTNSLDNLRKNLLRQMLDNSKFPEGRSLETLSRVTGAEPEECRRLLIEIGARGFTLARGGEGWTYVKKRQWSEQ
ncbi:TPA: hypothetical protein ACGJ7L_003787 [Pseudomonas aeruginosa]|nr:MULTISPECIES: hypothetical protein [Pseudomonas]SSU22561.1 Uncharacterised protein [Acinetobacter baumannii]HCL2714090.1 hypothetical protein [Pseudomonas aeruginosa EF8E]EIU1418087.1 hypothetical protein [Pseudomonas aeruginosa]EIU1657530.1 hypothetical protein [Pseudomonas aeruginosa]EIU2562729.1 hypothetical protein [Pseudomonas aeruginosa]